MKKAWSEWFEQRAVYITRNRHDCHFLFLTTNSFICVHNRYLSQLQYTSATYLEIRLLYPGSRKYGCVYQEYNLQGGVLREVFPQSRGVPTATHIPRFVSFFVQKQGTPVLFPQSSLQCFLPLERWTFLFVRFRDT